MARAFPDSANTDTIDCLLVCPFRLLGDMLTDLLSGTRFRITQRVASIGEARRVYGHSSVPEPFVILAFCCQDPGECDFVAWLTERHPESTALILASRFDRDYLAACINAGVDGLLHADMSAPGFVHSLELLRAGEKVFPSRLAAEIRAGDFASDVPEAGRDEQVTITLLNNRETDIVRILSGGASNKSIARAFSLSEAAVKMHLRQIFAKLKVQNRTQAATWALANGIAAARAAP